MRFLKTFFRTAVLSSISPIYYSDILKTKAWFSVKYFAMLQFILSLVASVAILSSLAQLDISRIISTVVGLFPSDLVITAQNGKVAINQPLPYEVPFPGYSSSENTLQARNIVVFDKEGSIKNIQDLQDRSTLIAVTESSFYVLKKSSEMSVVAIPILDQNIEITQNTFRSFGQRIMENTFIKYKLYVLVAAGIIIPIMFGFVLFVQTITLFFFSIVAWIVAKIFLKNGLGYAAVYRLSLHTITPVLLISTALQYMQKPYVEGWFYFLPYIVWTLVCLRAVEKPIAPTAHKKKS